MLAHASGFPSIAVPESQKKEDYYEKWVRAIVSSTFTDQWVAKYDVLEMLYKYYQDGSSGDLTGYLQTAPDGSALPAIWTSLNTIASTIDTLVGEMEARGYDIKVRALSKEAISRKLEEKERLRAERRILPSLLEAEQKTGIKLTSEEYIPQTEVELDHYMDYSFKDKVEIIYEGILKFIAEYSHWDEKRKRLFMDTLIANRCIVRNEIVRGIPQPRVIEPRKFIFDPNSTDDMLSDSTFFGEAEYMPLPSAAEQYGLTMKEIQEAYNTYQEFLGMGDQIRAKANYSTYFASIPSQRVRWFRIIDGTPRCLVLRTCWRDIKTLRHKEDVVNKYGVEQTILKDVTNDEFIRKRDADKVVTNTIEIWRQATLVGGKFLKEWGECLNQPVDLNTLSVTKPPYEVWIPNFFDGRSVSKLEQLVTPQLLKDIAFYHVQLLMAKAGGKGIVVDMAMAPEGWTQADVITHLKTNNLVFVNSKEYQMGMGNMNLFDTFDLTLSESLQQYFTIMQYLDSQIGMMSGVSQERKGQVQGSSTAVGVYDAALYASSNVTRSLYEGFRRFCERVLQHQANLARIAWANKEVFAPIIGDVGIDFLREHIDLDLEEVGVFVQEIPPSIRDRQKLDEKLAIYLQSSGGDPQALADVLAIDMEPDIKVAVRMFQRNILNRIKQQNIAAQQQSLQDQELQQMQMLLEQQRHQQQGDIALALQDKKNQGGLQKTLATGRVKLNDTKLKMLAK